MKEKIKKIMKKILLIILLLIGGSVLAGIVQEKIGYGVLHGLVILGMVLGFIKIIGIDSLWRKRNKKDELQLKPLWGEPLAELIRKITDRDLPTFVLMGLPEATVISVVDGFFCY